MYSKCEVLNLQPQGDLIFAQFCNKISSPVVDIQTL